MFFFCALKYFWLSLIRKNRWKHRRNPGIVKICNLNIYLRNRKIVHATKKKLIFFCTTASLFITSRIDTLSILLLVCGVFLYN